MSLWDPQFNLSGSVMRNSQIWPPEDKTIFQVSWFICSSERLYMRVSVCMCVCMRGAVGGDVPGTWGVNVLYWARMNLYLPDCAKHEGSYTWTELRIKSVGLKFHFWTCEYMVICVCYFILGSARFRGFCAKENLWCKFNSFHWHLFNQWSVECKPRWHWWVFRFCCSCKRKIVVSFHGRMGLTHWM